MIITTGFLHKESNKGYPQKKRFSNDDQKLFELTIVMLFCHGQSLSKLHQKICQKLTLVHYIQLQGTDYARLQIMYSSLLTEVKQLHRFSNQRKLESIQRDRDGEEK